MGYSPETYSLQREIPVSGATVNIQSFDGILYLILAPATDISSLTLNWPAAPYDSSSVVIMSTANIVSLLHTGNNINTSLPSMKSSGTASFVFDQTGAIYMNTNINSTTPSISLPYTATTAGGSGIATINPTNNGLSSGTALFSSISFVQAFPTIANPNIACGKWSQSGDLKTITIPCMTQTFTGIVLLSTNILGSQAVATSANGVSVTALITGVLA